MSQGASRDIRIDAIKGLAILAVIMGHSIAVPRLTHLAGPGRAPFLDGFMLNVAVFDPLYNVIQAFNMPLFAFVSGLLLTKSSLMQPQSLIRRRALTLMVPYLTWTLFGASQRAGATAASILQGIGQALLNPESGAAWFLYALFLCCLLATMFWTISGRRGLIASSLVAAATVMLPLGNTFGARNIALLYPFFVAGHVARGIDWRSLGSRLSAVVAIASASLALTVPTTVGGDRYWFEPARDLLHGVGVASKLTDVYLLSFVYHSARYVCAGSMIVLVFWLYHRLPATSLRLQTRLGQHSLGLYVVHQALLAPLIGWGVTSPLPLFIALLVCALIVTLLLEQVPLLQTLTLGIRPPSGATVPVPVRDDSGQQPR